MAISDWSTTASSNGNSDATINFQEGQAPSTVNDSARALMARMRHWFNWLGGNTTQGGSSNAYTLTSGESLSAYVAGHRFLWSPNADSTGNVTLNVDSIGAKKVYLPDGTQAGNGDLDADSMYDVVYDTALDSANGGFKIVGFLDTTLTASNFLAVANNLSDLSSASAARGNLGLGSLATLSSVNNSNWSGTDLAVTNGGTGASDAATARSNLGLGTMAVEAAADYAALAGADFTGNVTTTGRLRAKDGTTGDVGIGFGTDHNVGLIRTGADAMSVVTASVERMHFDATGNVGIGITSPALTAGYSGLHIGTVAPELHLTNTSNGATANDGLAIQVNSSGVARIIQKEAQQLEIHTNNTERMRIDSSGNVGIGTSTPGDKLEVNGDVTAVDFNATSDARLKENVEDLPYGLAEVLAMKPRAYDWIEQKEHDIGFIAQELEDIVPEVVSQKGEYKRVSYGKLVAVMAMAIQELKAELDDLREEAGL